MGGPSTSFVLGGPRASSSEGGLSSSNYTGGPSAPTRQRADNGTSQLDALSGSQYQSANVSSYSLNDDSDALDEYILDLNQNDDDIDLDLLEGPPSSSEEVILDPLGQEMFSPDNIRHPNSSQWWPQHHVAKFIQKWVKHPLEREARNIMKAECPRPMVQDKLCLTPNLDPELIKFLFKLGRDPRKGMERSLKSCQDRLLDTLGPLCRLIDLIEENYINGSQPDINLLRGWSQRTLILLGNANASLNTERRKVVLSKIDPKLCDMAEKESSNNPNGLLFGEDLIKGLGKYVATFTALDKAQSNMRRIFNSGVFARAGRRVRSPGRPFQRPFLRQRGFGRPFPTDSSFFPQRGRFSRPRGFRGRSSIPSNTSSKYPSSFSFFTTDSRGSFKTIPSHLGKNHTRPLDPSNCSGFQNRFH